MNGHDSTTRSGLDSFRPAGIGLAITRTCCTCGRHLSGGLGWRRHPKLKTLFECPACVSAREEMAAERLAERAAV
jgi:hypothetical protein